MNLLNDNRKGGRIVALTVCGMFCVVAVFYIAFGSMMDVRADTYNPPTWFVTDDTMPSIVWVASDTTPIIIAQAEPLALPAPVGGGFDTDSYTFSRSEESIKNICDSNHMILIGAVTAVADAVDHVADPKLITGQWVIDTFCEALLPTPDADKRKAIIESAKHTLLINGLADDDDAVKALDAELATVVVEEDTPK